MNDFAEEALTDEHMQRLQHDSELGCQSRYAGASEESGVIETYAAPAGESYEDEAPRTIPVWHPIMGPVNLAAAADDALGWLELLRGCGCLRTANIERLDALISDLRRLRIRDTK